MSIDVITRLAAANPVGELPVVEPTSAERLRRLIEDDMPQAQVNSTPKRRSLAGQHVLAAISVAVAASVAVVLLTAGSSSPGLNVAAAAYAATSPRSGIVEAVFLARIYRGSQAGGTLRQREWNDAGAKLRRVKNTTTRPYGDTHETHTLEMAFAPGRWEVWSSGREANTITRRKVRTSGLKFSMGFGGISLDGLEGVELYRKLYREGLMRLAGRERHGGRSLWKLESRPIGFPSTAHARLVVLVDPKTFLPVSERQIDIALRGHPTVVESNLLSYRRIPYARSGAKLFDLAAQHPAARVTISTFAPKFVSPRGHRPAAKRR